MSTLLETDTKSEFINSVSEDENYGAEESQA